jgi:RimJ/RimL family protein N-acetyltransferase
MDNFSFLTLASQENVKMPQLIGIISGVVVFIITIIVVVLLLYHSGTFSRFAAEVQSGVPVVLELQSTPVIVSNTPELYDHLLSARQSLPACLRIPALQENRVSLQVVSVEDCEGLVRVSDGRAIFHESAYDPQIVWGWSFHFDVDSRHLPFKSVENFVRVFCDRASSATHLVITDNELQQPIGMASLVNNQPLHLTVQIDDIWITPAYRGRKSSHEAVYLLLQFLFASGYRRVSCECDYRNLIGKKFLERCGFRCESILRKHKIFMSRNRDTAMYVMLNSEWEEQEIKFKRYLGIDLKPKMHKVAEIDDANANQSPSQSEPSKKKK